MELLGGTYMFRPRGIHAQMQLLSEFHLKQREINKF